MKIQSSFVALALALGLAAPAFAAGKAPALGAGGRTIAGPGAVTVLPAGSERVFSSTPGSDVCITVANTGKVSVGVSVTGATSPSFEPPLGGTETSCVEDVTAIDITCGEGQQSCAAQWRIDDN